MRPLILLILGTLFSLTLNAQISGLVKDDQGQPVKGATVTLLKSPDTGIVKLAASDASGAFTISGIKEGNYFLKASFVGFTSAPSAVNFTGSEVNVAPITLKKSNKDMKEVVVTASRPLVEVKADKMILNVEGTINAVGSDMMELLRKSPGVMVDKDDNISMSGKNGVQVYIDGRPSPLAGADLANYLKSIQSSQVEAIELISNPGAKYEAAGNAGIINIKLKKNKSLGTNGSVNAGYNIGVYPKYNGGIALNHRNAKVNIFGNYNYNDSKNNNNLSIYRSVADSIFDQRGTMTMINKSHGFKVGLDYFIDKKSTFGVIVNGNIADPTFKTSSRTEISQQPGTTLDRILIANNKNEMSRDNINSNLNYTYNNPSGRSLTLNADYGFYNLNSDQFQPNDYYDASGTVKKSSVVYQMIAPTKISIYSFKADYEQPFLKGKLGYGGKIGYVTSDNDFQRYNVFGSTRELDKDRSNRFEYKENINAGYVNFNKAGKGKMFQIGLRIEQTNIDGNSTGLKNVNGEYKAYDSGFKRNYIDFFPSAAITFNKNPKSQWSITYSRRIDRPVYQDLNPFEMKLDEYTFMKGNINLRPQYTNSFGVTHTYKFKSNTTLNYSHVNDMFAQLIDVVEGTKAFVSKRNIAKQDVISLNISYPFQKKGYSVLMNLNTNYSKYHANMGEGKVIDINAGALRFFAQNSYKFKKGWTAEVIGFYNAPTVMMGTFKVKSMWNVDAGVQKQIFKGNGTIKASVSDVFRTMKFRMSADYAGQQTTNRFQFESRQFKVAFSYRFGNNQVKAARQRAIGTDEDKRVGNGSTGIGQ